MDNVRSGVPQPWMRKALTGADATAKRGSGEVESETEMVVWGAKHA